VTWGRRRRVGTRGAGSAAALDSSVSGGGGGGDGRLGRGERRGTDRRPTLIGASSVRPTLRTPQPLILLAVIQTVSCGYT